MERFAQQRHPRDRHRCERHRAAQGYAIVTGTKAEAIARQYEGDDLPPSVAQHALPYGPSLQQQRRPVQKGALGDELMAAGFKVWLGKGGPRAPLFIGFQRAATRQGVQAEIPQTTQLSMMRCGFHGALSAAIRSASRAIVQTTPTGRNASCIADA